MVSKSLGLTAGKGGGTGEESWDPRSDQIHVTPVQNVEGDRSTRGRPIFVVVQAEVIHLIWIHLG